MGRKEKQMEYGKINTEMLICDIILGMEKPFKISEQRFRFGCFKSIM